MSWLWTIASVSVSSGVTNELWRREPIVARMASVICAVDSSCALMTAESWIVALRVTLRSIRGWRAMNPNRSPKVCCCIVRCAATWRTVHPSHHDGWSHCSGDSPSSRRVVRVRWSSTPAQRASASAAVMVVICSSFR